MGRDWGCSEAKRVGVHTGMAKGNKISILIFRAMVAWSGKYGSGMTWVSMTYFWLRSLAAQLNPESHELWAETAWKFVVL